MDLKDLRVRLMDKVIGVIYGCLTAFTGVVLLQNHGLLQISLAAGDQPLIIKVSAFVFFCRVHLLKRRIVHDAELVLFFKEKRH